MAEPINMQEARRHVLENPQLRESCFRFHYDNGLFGAQDEYAARVVYNANLQIRERANVLLDSYIQSGQCDLESMATGRAAPSPETRGSNDPVLRQKLGKAALATACGLVTLVMAQSINDHTAQRFAEYVGAAATGGGIVGGVIAYLQHKLF